jgi:hypothetical protein
VITIKIDVIAAVLAATAKGGSVPEVLFSVQIRPAIMAREVRLICWYLLQFFGFTKKRIGIYIGAFAADCLPACSGYIAHLLHRAEALGIREIK